MQEKNELSDIVLNKSGASNSSKKTILAVATLGIVLIIVVLLMKPGSSEQTDLIQPVPPKPQNTLVATNEEQNSIKADEQEPLFEEVTVIEESPEPQADLDEIAQKLKEESQTKTVTPTVTKTVKKVTPKKEVKSTQKIQKKTVAATKAVKQGNYYIQVGSFSKYEPNKKFLNSITNLGYNYKYHKVGSLNKVLVGPFPTRTEANKAKKVLRAKVEPGAFLVKL